MHKELTDSERTELKRAGWRAAGARYRQKLRQQDLEGYLAKQRAKQERLKAADPAAWKKKRAQINNKYRKARRELLRTKQAAYRARIGESNGMERPEHG